MKIVSDTDSGIQEAIAIIRDGGVVAHATETCYGFACDLTSESAVQKLFTIKQRPGDMPVSALFPSIEDARAWVEWSDAAEELAQQHLPGPLTIVLPLRANERCHILIYDNTEMAQDRPKTVGIRVSSHPIARQLAEHSGVPLSTTSANLHGKPEPYSAGEIVEQFQDQEPQPNLILDSGELPKAAASTVVEIANGDLRILRQGAIKIR